MGCYEFDVDFMKEMFTGKVIAMPNHKPIDRVVRVDEEGAWLEQGGRISPEGLLVYRPVKEVYKNE